MAREEDANCPRGSAVAELARRLQREGTGLRIELPEGWSLLSVDLPTDCTVDDSEMVFISLAARNEILAQAWADEIRSAGSYDIDRLFACAYQLWRYEIGQADQAAGRFLAIFSDDLDILSAAAKRIRDGARVFDVLHLVEAALPYIASLPTASIIDLFTAKHDPTKGDLFAGHINGKLEAWLEQRPDDAIALHAASLESLSEATGSLLGNAVFALSKSDYGAAVDLAMQDVNAEDLARVGPGIWALGRLLLVAEAPRQSLDRVIEVVGSLVESARPEVRSEAISASARALHVLPSFDEVLEQLAAAGDQVALRAAANALFLNTERFIARGILERWLRLLTGLTPDNVRAIQNWGYAMSTLLGERAGVDAVVSALKLWVSTHAEDDSASAIGELFDTTLVKLAGSEQAWSTMTTDWLLSDDQAHAYALQTALHHLGERVSSDLTFDVHRLNGLTSKELMFLARRTLGYVLDREQLTSLSMSMIRSNDAPSRVYPLLHELLVVEIGYDYPGSTIEACRQAANATSVEGDRTFLLSIADEIDRTHSAFVELPRRHELLPPPKLHTLLTRARAKQMNRSFEEASEKSVMRQLATNITIKAGTGTFSYRNSGYEQPMQLSTFSHSVEVPRREVFDPVGNAIRRLQFRFAERDEN